MAAGGTLQRLYPWGAYNAFFCNQLGSSDVARDDLEAEVEAEVEDVEHVGTFEGAEAVQVVKSNSDLHPESAESEEARNRAMNRQRIRNKYSK